MSSFGRYTRSLNRGFDVFDGIYCFSAEGCPLKDACRRMPAPKDACPERCSKKKPLLIQEGLSFYGFRNLGLFCQKFIKIGATGERNKYRIISAKTTKSVYVEIRMQFEQLILKLNTLVVKSS